MTDEETAKNTINKEDLEQMMDIFADAIHTSEKLYSILVDEDVPLVKAFAAMSLCSAMFLHESSIQSGSDIEQIQNFFFSGVNQACDLIAKIDKEAIKSSLQ